MTDASTAAPYGTRAYLHAMIDNFSRRILAWHIVDAFAPGNSVAELHAASQGATPSEHASQRWPDPENLFRHNNIPPA